MTDNRFSIGLTEGIGFGPRMISVLSGKGGVGKSVIAFNLAHQIGLSGRRVLLVDADFSCGNLHILANVAAEYGVMEFATGKLSLAEAVTRCAHSVDLLAAANGGVTNVDTSLVSTLAARLRHQAGNYDLIILDHGSGVSDPATVLAHASDLNVLVLIPELTSIADCYGLVKYLYNANANIDCRLLVNRVLSDDEAEYVQTKFAATAERFLRRVPGFLGHVPEDIDVRRSVGSQRPVIDINSQALVVQALTRVMPAVTGPAVDTAPVNRIETINNEPATADIWG
ncbi:MAG: P-loop NTPase [candidate division Zixibacteria bacterium]|nr:P-loop NTPase [candidate division Zixibacteria bacterium]